MASAFADALQHANLGTVRLNPESTIRLDPAAAVTLAEPAMVKLDPGTTLRVGEAYPRPSEKQLAAGGSPPSNAKVAINYAIFKAIAYGAGSVYTRWDFSSSEQDVPERQFCYYSAAAADGVSSIRIELAQDGKFLTASQNNKYNIDTAQASQQCIWFQ
ncbi:MAG: hypothetical protein ABSC06_08785 [Rhodopila sp.]|jgi:hypothetical protein